MKEFKKVSKEEFEKFIKEYPNKLVSDITRICEPPMKNYNDLSGGKVWPESMVAKIILEYCGPDGEIVDPTDDRFWEYYIPCQEKIIKASKGVRLDNGEP